MGKETEREKGRRRQKKGGRKIQKEKEIL